MNHEPTPEEIDGEQHAPIDDRPIMRRFALIVGGVVALALLIAVVMAQTKQSARVFDLRAPTREARAALLAELDAELATIVAVDRAAPSPHVRYRRDVVVVAAAVQRAAIAAPDNAPPRTLDDAGLRPDDLAPDLLYQSSGLQWRLFSSDRLLLARGN